MSVVLLDTVGLLALWDTGDQWHHVAQSAYDKLAQAKTPMVTTTFVLLECGNAGARRPFRLAVDRLCKQMQNEGALIVPTEDDWTSAWSAYRKGEADSAGIVDQVSFAVMRRLGLRQAFTNDRHFHAAGFELCF